MTEQAEGVTTEQLAGVRPPHSETQREAPPDGAAISSDRQHDHPLLGESTEFLDRWNAIQTTFVDEPRQAVEQADKLVAEVVQELARVFAEERNRLESAWSSGQDVSTEDLRQALQRYRDFFHVLLRS